MARRQIHQSIVEFMLILSREMGMELTNKKSLNGNKCHPPAGPWQWFLLKGKKNNTAQMCTLSQQRRYDQKQDSRNNDQLHPGQQLQTQQSKLSGVSITHQGSVT